MVIKEIMKSVAFGVGIFLAIPIVLPVAFAVARPLTRAAIRAYLNLRRALPFDRERPIERRELLRDSLRGDEADRRALRAR